MAKMTRWYVSVTLVFLLYGVTASIPASATGPSHASGADSLPSSSPALDYAFLFATAVPDDTDRPRAQESVVRELIEGGQIERARQLAAEIDGWRRGVVHADLAFALASAGRTDDAREHVALADQERKIAESWRGPRIAAHMTTALIVLGEIDRATEIAERLNSEERDYAGRSLAARSLALAREGKFPKAMEKLDSLRGVTDVYVSWWRTRGYVDLYELESLESEQRERALEAARTSAAEIPGWSRAEMLIGIAALLRDAGRPDAASDTLAAVPEVLEPLGDSLRLRRAALEASLGREWALLGEAGRSRELLRQAEARAAESFSTERAVVFARIAVSYDRVGDETERARLVARALAIAERQPNPRPRALALSSICRVLGGAQIDPDQATRARLDTLLTALGG
jgi:tetratricopeptide (TPR) repeat protein